MKTLVGFIFAVFIYVKFLYCIYSIMMKFNPFVITEEMKPIRLQYCALLKCFYSLLSQAVRKLLFNPLPYSTLWK